MNKQGKKWARIYEEWLGSGKRQRDYCKEKGISFYSFKNNIYKTGVVHQKKALFKAVSIPQSVSGDWTTTGQDPPYFEITFEGQSRIIVESRDSLVHLKQLIRSRVQS